MPLDDNVHSYYRQATTINCGAPGLIDCAPAPKYLDTVYMVFKSLCILVVLAKAASALKGLIVVRSFSKNNVAFNSYATSHEDSKREIVGKNFFYEKYKDVFQYV